MAGQPGGGQQFVGAGAAVGIDWQRNVQRLRPGAEHQVFDPLAPAVFQERQPQDQGPALMDRGQREASAGASSPRRTAACWSQPSAHRKVRKCDLPVP